MATSILDMGVRRIAADVADGGITVTEVAEAVLERIAEREGTVRGFSQTDSTSVRTQARLLTTELCNGYRRGPLHGVPVAVKEWFDVQGYRSLMKGDEAGVERDDSAVVARLRAAGALVVGKTEVPMFDRTPPTRNPWDLRRTPGGSSSGSAAVVSAGIVPLTIGEQTKGSNLRPAAYCGITGIKPTYGMVSRFGMRPAIWSMDHPGLMGRQIDDVAIGLSVISGPDPRDASTRGRSNFEWAGKVGAEAPSIGVVSNFFPELTESAMAEALVRSADELTDAGAQLVQVALPSEFELAWHGADLLGAERLAHSAPEWLASGNLGAPRSFIQKGSMRAGELIPAIYYLKALRIRAWLLELVEDVLARHSVVALLMGATPGTAPMGLQSTGDPVLLTPWSFLGLPAITVSGGLSAEGLPLGLQLVGARWMDLELLAVGGWCERVLGVLPPPPMNGSVDTGC